LPGWNHIPKQSSYAKHSHLIVLIIARSIVAILLLQSTHTDLSAQNTNEVTEEEYDKVFNVNVKSIYYATHVIVPYQQEKKSGGVWINIASTAGSRPRPGLTWYSASKAAVIIATKSLAVDYASDNIRFMSVSPAVGLGTAL
jgi:NAD(P)-dependent dehydrogenase (short-subunit alcohol dehydrogenase family)